MIPNRLNYYWIVVQISRPFSDQCGKTLTKGEKTEHSLKRKAIPRIQTMPGKFSWKTHKTILWWKHWSINISSIFTLWVWWWQGRQRTTTYPFPLAIPEKRSGQNHPCSYYWMKSTRKWGPGVLPLGTTAQSLGLLALSSLWTNCNTGRHSLTSYRNCPSQLHSQPWAHGGFVPMVDSPSIPRSASYHLHLPSIGCL